MRLFFFFSLLAYHLHLHSFPTRRSSDLTREPADVRFHPAIECSVLPASPPDGEVAWPLRCGADEVSGTMGGYRIIAHSAPVAAHGLFARGGAQAVTERRCRRARDVDGSADAASRRVRLLPR